MSEQRFSDVLRQIVAKHDEAIRFLEAERVAALASPEGDDGGNITKEQFVSFIDAHLARHRNERSVATVALASA